MWVSSATKQLRNCILYDVTHKMTIHFFLKHLLIHFIYSFLAELACIHKNTVCVELAYSQWYTVPDMHCILLASTVQHSCERAIFISCYFHTYSTLHSSLVFYWQSLPQPSVVPPQACWQRSTCCEKFSTRLIITMCIDGIGVLLVHEETDIRIIMALKQTGKSISWGLNRNKPMLYKFSELLYEIQMKCFILYLSTDTLGKWIPFLLLDRCCLWQQRIYLLVDRSFYTALNFHALVN